MKGVFQNLMRSPISQAILSTKNSIAKKIDSEEAVSKLAETKVKVLN